MSRIPQTCNHSIKTNIFIDGSLRKRTLQPPCKTSDGQSNKVYSKPNKGLDTLS